MKLPLATVLLLFEVDSILMVIITNIEEIDSDISHIIDGLVCFCLSATESCIIKSPLLGTYLLVVTAIMSVLNIRVAHSKKNYKLSN